MLTRLHVRGFKSLEDVEVELAPLVVLSGPNAAGKSNFQHGERWPTTQGADGEEEPGRSNLDAGTLKVAAAATTQTRAKPEPAPALPKAAAPVTSAATSRLPISRRLLATSAGWLKPISRPSTWRLTRWKALPGRYLPRCERAQTA